MYKKRYNKSYSRRKSNTSRPVRRFPTISHYELMNEINQSKSQNETNTSESQYRTETKFEDLEISSILKNNIKSKGYKTPTPIQDKVIPLILEGKDVIGIANTGTGKTAAFLVPLIDKVMRDKTQRVLIITPTRELASQIENEFRSFTKGTNVRSVLCIGGTSIYKQRKILSYNPSFVIGTPGRIMDLIRQKYLNLGEFENVVLDEVDRMVDIGFVKDIKFLVSMLKEDRQSLFFSATVSKGVRDILKTFVQEPVNVSVKQRDITANVSQEVIRVQKNTKVETLHNLLIQKGVEKTLVFGRTKYGVQKLSDELVRRGFKAEALHGDKRQSQRQSILRRFRRNETKILLATDVASRGLDINNISHVINYDLPDNRDSYIHRIGRTGRGKNKGIAITFVESYSKQR